MILSPNRLLPLPLPLPLLSSVSPTPLPSYGTQGLGRRSESGPTRAAVAAADDGLTTTTKIVGIAFVDRRMKRLMLRLRLRLRTRKRRGSVLTGGEASVSDSSSSSPPRRSPGGRLGLPAHSGEGRDRDFRRRRLMRGRRRGGKTRRWKGRG